MTAGWEAIANRMRSRPKRLQISNSSREQPIDPDRQRIIPYVGVRTDGRCELRRSCGRQAPDHSRHVRGKWGRQMNPLPGDGRNHALCTRIAARRAYSHSTHTLGKLCQLPAGYQGAPRCTPYQTGAYSQASYAQLIFFH